MDFRSSPQAIPPLVVAGMHRSGTSLAASILVDAGVSMGDELVPATAGNPRGHFEDVAFFRLQQRMLMANGLMQEGYACPERIPVPAALRREAEALVDRRRAAARPWGWKDPRTTLFLDFWDDLLPDARYLLVFRPPWEVVDSLFRRGDGPLQDNPRLALELWLAYNRRIRDFARRRPDRCLLVDTACVASRPERVVERVGAALGVSLAAPAPRYEADLLVTRDAATHAMLVRCARPEALDLLAELRHLADGDATGAGGAAGAPDAAAAQAAEAMLAEWARTGAAVGERAIRDRERAERDRALEAAVAERDRLAAASAALAAEVEAQRAARLTLEAQACGLAEQVRSLTTAFEAERSERAAAERAHADERAARAARHAAELQARADAAAEAGRRFEEQSAVHAREIEAERARRLSIEEAATGRIKVAAEEAARIAAQLQAERETFESLRRDLVARLEAAVRQPPARLTVRGQLGVGRRSAA